MVSNQKHMAIALLDSLDQGLSLSYTKGFLPFVVIDELFSKVSKGTNIQTILEVTVVVLFSGPGIDHHSSEQTWWQWGSLGTVTADTFSPVTHVHVTKFPYLSAGALR